MFDLTLPTNVELTHFQTRPEHHGEALVTAMDATLLWTANNRVLAMLHPALRESLYSMLPAGAHESGDQHEMDMPSDDLNFMKFALLKYPLKWEAEYTGYTMRVEHGLGGDSDMVISQCKVHKFAVTPLEGGSVEIKFTVSSNADIDERIAGKLAMLQQSTVVITLLAPALQAGDAIDSSAGSGAPGVGDGELRQLEAPAADKKVSKARQSAEELFIQQHGGSNPTVQ